MTLGLFPISEEGRYIKCNCTVYIELEYLKLALVTWLYCQLLASFPHCLPTK